MAEITNLSGRALSKYDQVERIVSAAKGNAGLWLMVKERAMEMRAISAELKRLGADASDVDRLFPAKLTPTIAELTEKLVSAIFGSGLPELPLLAEAALLQAAEAELDKDSSQST
ncbi:hypothetical protein HFN63_32940 [Rhizobium leguminosarum]|uniref:hypothetical protein n=1 Tax=Rhizobium leguminosarum TaxID=384 RepID=UPI001C961921|nr:hypothetical protein [Rhizobium leguminosarum]MBY5774839.1 hypothetical protein [Rhizobium leguminosarum]